MNTSAKFGCGTALLVDIGTHYDEGPVFLEEIARPQEISKKCSEQIIVGPRTVGLPRTVRDSKGGHCLAKDPQENEGKPIVVVFPGTGECCSSAGSFRQKRRKV